MRRQDGQAVVIVLVVMMVLQVVAWAFLSRMNLELRLAGSSVRTLSALYLAEGGLQRVLHALEEPTPEGAVRSWPVGRREALGSGTVTVEALERHPGGLISIVVRGEVAGARRRVKATVMVGPEALDYGVYARHIATFEGEGRTYVLPLPTGREACRRSGALAAGVEVRFNSPRAALNGFGGVRLALREGEIPDHALLGSAPPADPEAGLVDLILAGGARLVSGIKHAAVGLDELRGQVRELGVRRLENREPLPAPALDPAYYEALAEANTANASINRAAGERSADRNLRAKPHSRYSVEEFEAILSYLRDRRERILQGTIFVEGDVYLEEEFSLTVTDGALVVIGDVVIGEGARLDVRRPGPAVGLAGLVAWGEGMIQIQDNATAVVDGLVLAEGDVVVLAGVLDVAGAIAARNFLNRDGTVVVRYDPAVLATAGLRRTGRGIVRLVSWQELL